MDWSSPDLAAFLEVMRWLRFRAKNKMGGAPLGSSSRILMMRVLGR